MSPVTEAAQQLFKEIKADPAAYARLQDKARWEGVSLFAVLRKWGDPRKWPAAPARIRTG